MSVYFGGSRSKVSPAINPVVLESIQQGKYINVGCQFGADRAVIETACAFHAASCLSVFVVSSAEIAPSWVLGAQKLGASISFNAGGPASIPTPARFLRRSIAAFQGCSIAAFFEPGTGSLAVAREFIKQYPGRPVYIFQNAKPTPAFGGAFYLSSLYGFLCWQFEPAQQNFL